MRIKYICLLLFSIFGLTACLSQLTSSTPPSYYQLDYTAEPSDCPARFEDGLRIWAFGADTVYDREEMAITDPSLRVEYSRQNRWVAAPGQMLADLLVRDLAAGQMFASVVFAGDVYDASKNLSGRIFEFAWKRDGSKMRAVLDVEATFWEEKPKRRVIFRSHYHIEGDPSSESSPARFATEMSGVVKRFTAQVRRDICSAATNKDSLSPAAD